MLKNSQHMRASISTFHGVEFFPLAPRFEDIWLEDIAHALSNMCRYNGHSREFYSVAQHSVLVSQYAEQISGAEGAKWGLLHDASEAYIPDMCAPIKPFFPTFGAVEDQLLMAVSMRFGLSWPVPGEIKYADKAVFRSELDSCIMLPVTWWRLDEDHPSAGVQITPLDSRAARAQFLQRARELWPEMYEEAAGPCGPTL